MSEMYIIIIYEYCLRIRAEYENNFIQQFNNLFSVKCKSSDLRYLADLKHDLELVDEVLGHILRILQMKLGESYYK